MTDYWKSTPTHWCEVCKIWIKDIQNNVANHERSERHQDRLAKKIADQRRDAEKEATKNAKMLMTLHDIESKALASYAADLKERGNSSALEKTFQTSKRKQKIVPTEEKRKITVEIPKHPHQAIGGYSIPDIRNLGVQKGGIKKKKAEGKKVHKIRVDENAEEKAKRLRREAQERVKKREQLNFGLRL